ncbi:MAG TPA: hypothetical protein VFJ49_10125 [Methyloceanibacter sp.]|nr:hypothetical protein [Methyloceanibacter sp.]
MNPYLTFNGNCEEAFATYQKILGGEIAAMIPHEGTPAEEGVPPEWRKKIIHARLVGNGMVLMGSDAPPDRYQPGKASRSRSTPRSLPRPSASSMHSPTRQLWLCHWARPFFPQNSRCSPTSLALPG